MKTPTTFLNRALMTSRPSFRLCRSAVLISAAIAVTSANAVVIGRLPSTSVTGGEVIGVKPNLFIIIENTASIYADKEQQIDFIKNTAAGLRESIKPLIGKVRLGFTTTRRVIDPRSSAANLKLDGNSGPYGNRCSGFGQLAPHRFDKEYYQYFSYWLGAMCPLISPDKESNNIASQGSWKKNYPALNLVDNYLHTNAFDKVTEVPTLDVFAFLISMISDKQFLVGSGDQQTAFINGNTKMGQDLQQGKYRFKDPILREYIEHPKDPRTAYTSEVQFDAYAPINPETGYPKTSPALSCRQNFAILISSKSPSAANWFKGHQQRTTYSFTLNDGQHYDPNDPQYGYIYKTSITGLKNSEYLSLTRGSQGKGNGGRMSNAVFDAYMYDLRSDLPDDVPAYMAEKDDITGINGKKIPPYWNYRNDPATWQHLTTFAVGYTAGLPTWAKARDAYNKITADYKKYGTLAGYFRAVELGYINEQNPGEYFWERKGAFPPDGVNDRDEIIKKESYIFKKKYSSVDCSGDMNSLSKIRDLKNSYTSIPGVNPQSSTEVNCGVFVGAPNLKKENYSLTYDTKRNLDFFPEADLLRAGMIGRGGSYAVDDAESFKTALSSIFSRIESAMASGVTGGSVGGGSRITGTIQQAGGSNSVLFTTYMDEETTSGNLFTFKNCPLIQKKIRNAEGKLVDNPLWAQYNCGVRLWNAATVLNNEAKTPHYLANKTIVPIKQADGSLGEKNFTWANVKDDAELKAALQSGGTEALGKARLEWINGRLQSTFSDDDIKAKLRVRTTVSIPEENQRYSRDENGKLVKDDNGKLIEAKTTRIPNRMGEIVYAAPQAVEPVGTLPAAHPLNDQSYTDFIKSSIVGNDRRNPARPPMVIVGANDGRLYGFTSPKPNSGYAELKFSFIPRTLLINGSVTDTTSPNYNTQNARSLVNGPFTVRDAKVAPKNGSEAWGTYVVGTLGAGGNAIYALDISSGQAEFKWEVRLSDLHSKADDKTPISGAGNMEGAIMAPPRIVWLRDTRKADKPAGKWVVLVPSGYNSNEVSLLVLDLANGELLANIQTGARYSKVDAESNSSVLTCELDSSQSSTNGLSPKITLPVDSTVGCDNGLGPLTAVDSNSDGGVDYVYAGDLLGHIWKFDLTEFFSSGKGKVAYNGHPLFVAQTHGNKPTRQPITSMIEVADSQNGEGNMLYFGTGRLFNQEERGLNQQETFYAVWDNPRYFEDGVVSLPMNRASKTGYQYAQYVSIPLPFKNSKLNDGDAKDSILRDNKRFGDLRGIKRYQDSTTSTAYLACNLDNSCLSDDGIMGWAMDFPPANGEGNPALERVIDRGQVFENAIYFSSFTPTQGENGESCDTKPKTVGGEGRFYSLNRFTGNYLAKSPFDLNHDNKRDEKDSIKVSSGEMGKGQGDDYATDGNGNYLVGLAGVSLGSTNGSFVSLQGVPGINPPVPECDFTRQIIFPASVDTETGDPLTLTGCYQNRFNVWKQPVDE